MKKIWVFIELLIRQAIWLYICFYLMIFGSKKNSKAEKGVCGGIEKTEHECTHKATEGKIQVYIAI